MSFRKDELIQYARHLLMPEIGMEGQKKLKAASVVVIGAGGLGSPAALYLAAAGVGRLGIVDFDRVEASNLQRQILYTQADIGQPKAETAMAQLHALNPFIEVEVHEVQLSSSTAMGILGKYDVVVDGSDNFSTRYVVNDACVMLKKPNVYGSIFRFEGQASIFSAANGPCYRCLYPEPPEAGLVPNCAEAGVLGVLPGIVGTIQATEAIKLIVGLGKSLVGRLLVFDALRMEFRELKLQKNSKCPVCSEQPTIRTLVDLPDQCAV